MISCHLLARNSFPLSAAGFFLRGTVHQIIQARALLSPLPPSSALPPWHPSRPGDVLCPSLLTPVRSVVAHAAIASLAVWWQPLSRLHVCPLRAITGTVVGVASPHAGPMASLPAPARGAVPRPQVSTPPSAALTLSVASLLSAAAREGSSPLDQAERRSLGVSYLATHRPRRVVCPQSAWSAPLALPSDVTGLARPLWPPVLAALLLSHQSFLHRPVA